MNLMTDPPEMHKVSAKLTNLSGEYTTIHNRLIDTANTMGNAWNAADNLAFVEQINGFCEELKGMAAHLDQAAAALKQQANNYETTRDNNVSGVKQLAN